MSTNNYTIQVCLVYNVILNVLTVIVVSNIMGSVSEMAEVISKGPSVNSGCFGRGTNIFNIYARVLGLQHNIQ